MGNKAVAPPIFVGVQSPDDNGRFPKESLLDNTLIPSTETFPMKRARASSCIYPRLVIYNNLS